MTIRAAIASDNPEKTAEAFRLMLAVDRGYTSELRKDGDSYVVVASDKQAVRFTKAATMALGRAA